MPSIPKFADAAERPPTPGGWHYYYDINNRETLFRAYSPEEAFEQVKRYRSNNRTFTSDEDLERELWGYWCSLQPERCGLPASDNTAPLLPMDQRPEFFGPIIWKFLNLAASRFDEIGKAIFLAIANAVFPLMSCPKCRAEYASIIASDPPDKITSKKQAAEWVNRVHNSVNKTIGKPAFSYAQMIREYGAPV